MDKMTLPKISVFIPVYNTEKYIAATIDCVLAQSYTDFELVIVDDASTDSTYSVCEQYAQKDQRIKLYRNEKNLGMMPNWIHGIQFCSGQYWGKLDADDIWKPDMLERCVAVLDTQPEVGMVVSGFEYIDEESRTLPGTLFRLPEYARNKAFSMLEQKLSKGMNLFEDKATQQGIGLIRRSFFEEHGNFTLLPAGDSEMWFRIGAHYKIYGIDACLHLHRIWSQSFTRTEVLGVNKADKNLIDVRKAIFEYYHRQQLISDERFRQLTSENEFALGKYQVAKALSERSYGKAAGYLLANFAQRPGQVIRFYTQRLKEKL